MDLKEEVTTIQKADQVGLTVTNKTVVVIAKQLRMNPARLIERTQACLPAVIEQQFYLTVAGDMTMKPETFAKILRMFLGSQTLHVHDLESREISPDIFYNKFDNVAEFVVGVMELCNKEIREFTGYQISFNSAAKLLLEYGSVKNVEMVIDSIIADLDEVQEKLKIKNSSPEVIITKALNILVRKIIPQCYLAGQQVPLRFMEYYERRRDEDYLYSEEKRSEE